IIAASYTAIRVAIQSPNAWLASWGSLIFAYNTSFMALTFSYVPFIAQIGLEFWLLNAALFTVAFQQNRLTRSNS
ncbi:MAG: hypothetical protein ACRCZF_21465, partial [Gemmataceae bacterium]